MVVSKIKFSCSYCKVIISLLWDVKDKINKGYNLNWKEATDEGVNLRVRLRYTL